MSDSFWVAVLLGGGAAYLYWNHQVNAQKYGADGLPLGGVEPGGFTGQGTNTYGPFPGTQSVGAAGQSQVGLDTTDNSRLFDPYAQSASETTQQAPPPLVAQPFSAGDDANGVAPGWGG
jgi:hypothetical protein